MDKQRHLCVRARAARSLGRCHLPTGINAEKLVFQILLLENEMALAYQNTPNAYYWLDCFADLYFAFHPVSEREIKLFGSKRPPGLNAKNLGNAVRDAYTGIAAHRHPRRHARRLDSPQSRAGSRRPTRKFPIMLISNLAKWLQDHQPSNHKLAPNLPELAPTSPMPNGKVSSTDQQR